ncbi:hypothetical protein DIPPA_63268 [Diplonema papillatum]|nr:hypothetical protein DIPPA_63268 [Diplonema papillatum]
MKAQNSARRALRGCMATKRSFIRPRAEVFVPEKAAHGNPKDRKPSSPLRVHLDPTKGVTTYAALDGGARVTVKRINPNEKSPASDVDVDDLRRQLAARAVQQDAGNDKSLPNLSPLHQEKSKLSTLSARSTEKKHIDIPSAAEAVVGSDAPIVAFQYLSSLLASASPLVDHWFISLAVQAAFGIREIKYTAEPVLACFITLFRTLASHSKLPATKSICLTLHAFGLPEYLARHGGHSALTALCLFVALDETLFVDFFAASYTPGVVVSEFLSRSTVSAELSPLVRDILRPLVGDPRAVKMLPSALLVWFHTFTTEHS